MLGTIEMFEIWVRWELLAPKCKNKTAKSNLTNISLTFLCDLLEFVIIIYFGIYLLVICQPH